MFGELPKLLGRDFAIGFFLPAAFLTSSFYGVLSAFGFASKIEPLLKLDNLFGAAISIVFIWLISIVLIALNLPILRLYEGYGRYHPIRLCNFVYKRKFRNHVLPVIKRQNELDEARRSNLPEPELPPEHAEDLYYAVENYPDDEMWVLPTKFGNLLRSFEVYSRIVYGIDAIPAWPRLDGVMPEQMRSIISGAKSQLDFCINLSAASWSASFLYICLGVYQKDLPQLWIIPIGIGGGYVAYRLGLSAASDYGLYIKSAFDLYRGELARQLGLEMPRSVPAEREMWKTVSRMMIYRSPARADELTKFRSLQKKLTD